MPLCFSSVCPGPFPWRTWLLTFQVTWQEKLLPFFFFCWISTFYRLCTPFFLCQILLLQLSDFSVSLYFSSLLILFCIYYRLYSVVTMGLTNTSATVWVWNVPHRLVYLNTYLVSGWCCCSRKPHGENRLLKKRAWKFYPLWFWSSSVYCLWVAIIWPVSSKAPALLW